MSGGFFRGTSAEQDTRFSNKQAKLLKSQKFAPELEHLVDMNKVKMDAIRPWIAKRVTELLGFEDEVLINFIYGLLDGKDVNGKEVQISLTGFMEKNTGKFMKELWALLLSAQTNASGVPQQFLDAKEEETRKKKAESDRIANEIQKKREKENRELETEKLRKMDGGVDKPRGTDDISEPNSRQVVRRSPSTRSDGERETAVRNGLRRRNRASRSTSSSDRSVSPVRGRHCSRSRSLSSRSHSVERLKSRSISCSPPRGRSTSSERVHRSPQRRSITPRRRHSARGSFSPSRRKSSYGRRRSTSRSHYRSRTPIRRRVRSPFRGRSPSPVRRRSPSPFRRRHSPMRRRSPRVRRRSPSPMLRRSPSPVRRRSPHVRHRSPLAVRRRSQSPVRRRPRSPVRRRSPSPLSRSSSPIWLSPSPVRRSSPSSAHWRRRRSSSTPHHKSLSPTRRRSPVYGRRRSPFPSRRRSSSPDDSSASPVGHRSPSPVRSSPDHQKSSSPQSPDQKIETHDEASPARRASPGQKVDSAQMHKGHDSVTRRPLISLRSPQRDSKVHKDSGRNAPSLSPSQQNSRRHTGSPSRPRKRSPREDRRSSSSHESPVRKMREDNSTQGSRKSREQNYRQDSPEKDEVNKGGVRARERLAVPRSSQNHSYPPKVGKEKDSSAKVHYKEEYASERLSDHRATESQSYSGSMDQRRMDQETTSVKTADRTYRSGASDQGKSSASCKESSKGNNSQPLPTSVEGYEADKRTLSQSKEVKGSNRHNKVEVVPELKTAVKVGQRNETVDSGSEESDRHKLDKGRRKSKRHRKEKASDDDYSSDSEIEDRKEAKRRKREDKRLRKEEKRRRREERRRRKEEKRAEKMKAKSTGVNDTASDSEKDRNDAYASGGERGERGDKGSSDTEETEYERKRLEIELRKKALETLRAKKGINR